MVQPGPRVTWPYPFPLSEVMRRADEISKTHTRAEQQRKRLTLEAHARLKQQMRTADMLDQWKKAR